MISESENDRKNKAFSLLNKSEFGILSTSSSDVVNGYPLGSVISYLLLDRHEVVLIANNLSDYRRNFAINEKVCLTILTQNGDKETERRFEGLNFFGKVISLDKNEIEVIQEKFIEKFPVSKYLLRDTSNKFYKISLSKLKYFDSNGSYWINLNLNI